MARARSASPRARRVAVVAAVLVVSVAVVGIAVVAVPESAQLPVEQGRVGGQGASGGAAPLVAPRPGRIEAGVPMGFPRSRRGAVAAAAHYAQALVTLDTGRARAVGTALAVPGYQAAGGELAAETRRTRRAAGLAPRGPERGASAALTAEAYQLQAYTAGRARVWILGTVSVVGPATGGVGRSRVVAAQLALTWAEGGWRVVRPIEGRGLPERLETRPGTPAAAQRGWRPVVLG